MNDIITSGYQVRFFLVVFVYRMVQYYFDCFAFRRRNQGMLGSAPSELLTFHFIKQFFFIRVQPKRRTQYNTGKFYCCSDRLPCSVLVIEGCVKIFFICSGKNRHCSKTEFLISYFNYLSLSLGCLY